MTTRSICRLACIGLGSAIGVVVADAKFAPPSGAVGPTSPQDVAHAAIDPCGGGDPAACCSDGTAKGTLMALASTAEATATEPAPPRAAAKSPGERPSLQFSWGDGVDVHEIGADGHGVMGHPNPRADLSEKSPEPGMDIRWSGENFWLFVPARRRFEDFLAAIPRPPSQEGNSPNAAGIDDQSPKAMSAPKPLQEIEGPSPPRD